MAKNRQVVTKVVIVKPALHKKNNCLHDFHVLLSILFQ
jgi:hypothetical protein